MNKPIDIQIIAPSHENAGNLALIPINWPSRLRTVLSLLVVWLVVSWVLAYRIEKMGAFASVDSTKALQYVKNYAHANPASCRLNQSYRQWALALNGTDAASYLKTGIGFAEGHGVTLKEISPEHPNSNTYIPYYYQAPGAAVLIGIMIKLFGGAQVFPYFLLVSIVHLFTALLTCCLASQFVKEEEFILGAGLLSLLCLPALSFNFGLGIFCGEPLAGLFIGSSLLCLSLFLKNIERSFTSYKSIIFSALGFGCCLALSAYFRDIYSAFAQFCFAVLLAFALVRKNHFKQILAFILISAISFSSLEYPWEKRNQKLFKEFTMTGSTYCGYALWCFTWNDYKDSERWAYKSGHGLGNFLAPDKSAEVLAKLEQNKRTGSVYAMECLARAVMARPWDAIRYKLDAYPTLWFGRGQDWPIYSWCLISTIIFFVFLGLTRFKISLELLLFPLFLICLSPLIHYEHRYSQPFFLFSTPVASMYVLRHLKNAAPKDFNQDEDS